MTNSRPLFLPIPGSGQVSFEPGGLHVMLVDLQRDLEEGEQFELILRFQQAGEITLQVPVEQRQAFRSEQRIHH